MNLMSQHTAAPVLMKRSAHMLNSIAAFIACIMYHKIGLWLDPLLTGSLGKDIAAALLGFIFITIILGAAAAPFTCYNLFMQYNHKEQQT